MAVGDGLFRSSPKRNRCNHSPFHGIDDSRTLRPAIEDKNPFRHGVIDDGVCVHVGLDLTDRLERLEIENNNLTRITISDETAAEIVEYNNTVAAFQIRDGPDDRAAVGFHHFDLGSMREIHTASRGIERDVVEILNTTGSGAEWNLLQEVIA